MQVEIEGAPAFCHLRVTLEPGESITTEADAMASMDSNLDLEARLAGGLLSAFARRFLASESLFLSCIANHGSHSQQLVITQPIPGEITAIDLSGGSLYLQPGAFLACTEGISLATRWAGLVSFLNGEGLFRLRVSGRGTVWLGAYGALIRKYVDGEYIVDSSHLVAYPPEIQLKLQLSSGLFSSFFGGEGLVTRVTGEGEILLQTRSLSGLSGWLNTRW